MCVITLRCEREPNSFYYKGFVDLDAEIAKCDKKLTLAHLNLEQIMKIVSQPDYAETVPSVVQISNDEKVASLSFDHQN
jgi:valyl-tRNA synthetase